MIQIYVLYILLIVVDMKEVFDLFDFWDGWDGLIDVVKVGDFFWCCGFNLMNVFIYKNGGIKKFGNLWMVVYRGCWVKGLYLFLI